MTTMTFTKTAPPQWLLDMWKEIDDKTTMTFGVQNLFDEAPPSISSSYRVGNSEIWGYELRGRRGFLSIERSW